MTPRGILTAMVTPFDAEGRVDEAAGARLMGHLLENGSDGLVVAGTTGESPTLSDDEKCALWELAVAECGDAPVIAGTGSNDTAHSIELTARATEIGVDAVLVVCPYYNKPPPAGLKAHYEAVAAATDRPVILYNIPGRSVIDMPNALLAELAEIPNVSAVKQARTEDVGPIEGLDLLAGNDDSLADVLDMGGTGGITVASNIAGPRMHAMIDEPERRQEIHSELEPLFGAMSLAASPIPLKAAMAMLGLDSGRLRLPLVEASEEQRGEIRGALETTGLLSPV